MSTTQGPWEVEQEKNGTAKWWVRGPDGVFIAAVGNGTNGDESQARAEANARLIATAPDLRDLALMLVGISELISREDMLAGLGLLVDQATSVLAKSAGRLS
jgi:hypothetical protein